MAKKTDYTEIWQDILNGNGRKYQQGGTSNAIIGREYNQDYDEDEVEKKLNSIREENYKKWGINNLSPSDEWNYINNGYGEYFQQGGTTGGIIDGERYNVPIATLNEYRQKLLQQQMDELYNRPSEEWKSLINEKTNEINQIREETNALLKARGINAHTEGMIIPDTSPSMNEVKVGSLFNPNNLQNDANNRVATINYIHSEEGLQQQDKLNKAWSERAHLISDYEVIKAIKDEGQLSDISKLAMRPIQGAASMFSWLRGDLTTDEGRLSSYNEAFLQQTIQNAKNPIIKIAYQALGEYGKQQVVSVLNQSGIPYLGSALYFLDIADDQYNKAIRNGYSSEAATNYAILSTGSEIILERLLGAASEYFGETSFGAESILEGVLGKVIKNPTVNKILSSTLSEGFEEFVEEYTGEYIEQLTLNWADKGENIDWNRFTSKELFENALESGIVGAIVGGSGKATEIISTPKNVRNLNNAIYFIEENNGPLSDYNKNLLTNLAGLSEELGHSMTTQELIDEYNRIKQIQIDAFRDNAIELYPNLDEETRILYNNLINDISQLIYETGINIRFDPTLKTVTAWDGNTLLVNPTLTDSPIKTIILKELGSYLLNKDAQQDVIDYAQSIGIYDELRQELLNSGEYTTENVNNEIISRTLNSILQDNAKLEAALGENQDAIASLQNFINNLVGTITNNRTTKDAETLKTIANQLNKINLLENNISGKELLSKLPKNGTNAKPTNTFKATVTNYTGAGKKTIKNAVDSKLLKDNSKARTIVNLAARVSEHINKAFEFTNNENLKGLYKELKQKKEIKKGEVINGYVDGDKVVVNLDSPEAINFIIGHEVSHAMRSSNYWENLRSSLFNLAKYRGDYDTFYNRIKSAYPKITEEQLAEELVSDLLGKYLFTDKEFIDKISENKSLLEKIIDVLKDLWNSIFKNDSNNEEKKLVKDAIDAYEKAYNDKYESTDSGRKLSVSETAPTKDNYGRELSKGQQKYFGKSKIVDENGNLLTIYHTTTHPINQFNVFNPVGTPGYRFGDDVVIYGSNDKVMSGSYASYSRDYEHYYQLYDKADSSKFKNIKDVEKWLDNNQFVGDKHYKYNLEQLEDGSYTLHLRDYKTEEPFRDLKFTDKKDLLRNVRQQTLGAVDTLYHSLQYEMYMNMTNPYEVDAGGRYWNSVARGIETSITDFINKINKTPELKDRLIRLAKESRKLHYDYENNGKKKQLYTLRDLRYDLQGNVGEIVSYAYNNNLDYDVVARNIGEKILSYLPDEVIKHTPSGNALLYDFISENYRDYYTDKFKGMGLDINKITIKQFTNLLRELRIEEKKYSSYDTYFMSKIKDILGEQYKYLTSSIGEYTIFDIAEHEFSDNYLSESYGTDLSTNDIVKKIISENRENNAGYDGIIFKNVIDYGGSAHPDDSTHNVYVVFDPNQVKAVENKTPTKDPDWRYSLSETPTEEYGNFNIYGSEIASYKSNEKLPETTKTGTYIEPTTPIKEDSKKGKRFIKQITNQNVLSKEISKNYTSFVDKLHPIQELADASGNKQLYAKFNNRGMSNGKGQYQIGTAQTDNNGKEIGKPINAIFKPVESAGLSTEFDDYLAHKLNIERYDKTPVWDKTVTPEISQEIVDEYEAKFPQFKGWANDVYTFNDNQLQKMIDAGLTKESARNWLYDNYVTISREVGPRTNPLLINSKGVKVNSPIRKAKGSNLEMRPMKEAMARQTLLTERAIADNIAGQELLNVLGGTVGETKNLLTQDIEGNNNALVKNPDGTYNYTVYKNGIPVTMQVTKEIADAIKPIKTQEWEDLAPFKAVRAVSGLQRSLLTDKNPLFILTNFFKDIGDAPLNSKFSAAELYVNYPIAVSKMLSNSSEWKQYVANGGLENTYFETKSGEFVKSKNKFVNMIQTVNQLVEQAPRFTEYLNTLAHGGTIAEALYNSAEVTTNFARGGEITKILNRNGFNFLNASVQGFDKQIRNFTNQPGAKGYVQLLAKVAILGIAPALINHILLGDDDDYEELPDYVKDNYYLFKTGENKFIRIPKGRVMSVFGTAARHLYEIGRGKEDVKTLITDTGTQLMNNVAPNNPLENNILSPLISVANNKSWNGSKIVSTTLQNYPDSYQYDEKTSSIAKWLGKTFNYSPKKIDYLLDQYTGAVGDYILPMTTPYAETESDNIVYNALLSPLKSKFTVDSTITNKYVSEFYDKKDELQKEVKTYGSIEDSDESFRKSLQYKYLDKVGSDISALYVKKREIENSDLSDSEKYKQARDIQRQIDDLAKFAMQDYQTGYYSDAYANIGDKEFYTTLQNGKMIWSPVDEKTKKKQEEYAQKYDMSPDDYYSMDGLTQSAIVGSNVYDFYAINKKLTQIRDNTTNDKEETIKYINSLDLSLPQKAMYLRTYYKSFNDYNEDIFNYVNSLDMIYDQKKAILIYLGFDYDKNTGTFSWK